MGKLSGFMEFQREEPGYRPVDERLGDYRAVERPPEAVDLRQQAARCMDCGVPFCHAYGCPLANVIPEFNDWVYKGRWREAWQVLRATNNFPEFTGRICPAPCEPACVLAIGDAPVTIRQLELAIVEQAFERGYIKPEPPAVRRPAAVAVIGSGPAGLAVADTLNRQGFAVTVFDDAPKAGGILRYGIPEFKLEKWVVDRRLDLMKAEGVSFEMGVHVGRDLSYRYLKDRFAALCLCSGAREPRELALPGRELAGIYSAMVYLKQQNKLLDGVVPPPDERIDAAGRRVVVIGGGDTGSDCVGTALRQGALCVTQMEILSRPPDTRSPLTPWPRWPLQVRESSSHQEGCERRWSVATEAFEGDAAGRVAGLRAVRVDWRDSQAGGPPEMHKQPDSAFRLDADLVLLALGFTGPRPNPLVRGLGIATDPGGRVLRDANAMTNVAGIFVAGDMCEGASLVVRAMADGRRAAEGIARVLQ